MVSTKSKTPPYLGENLSQIKKMGLQGNINDLEIDGFTVIPPKKVASTHPDIFWGSWLLQTSRKYHFVAQISRFSDGFSKSKGSSSLFLW